jgi:ABC-type dipeptide/oligopeptide/nickel transport system permease subunit
VIADTVLAEMQDRHIEAAQVSGASPVRVLVPRVAPNVTPLARVIATT